MKGATPNKIKTITSSQFPQEHVDLKTITAELEETAKGYYYPQPWSVEEDALLKKYYRKVPIEKISEIFTKHGIPHGRGAISHRLKLLGIRERHRRPLKSVTL